MEKNSIVKESFDFNQVPYNWALCYISECCRKEECMRYQVCKLAPIGLTRNNCVLPTVMNKKECPHFTPIQVVRAAVGFSRIFAEVKEKHHAAMRRELAGYLGGGGTFYRYRNGERLLMPEQQEWIKKMFLRFGYTEEIVIDDYKEVYRFDDY